MSLNEGSFFVTMVAIAVYDTIGHTDFYSDLLKRERSKLDINFLDYGSGYIYTQALDENLLLKEIISASEEMAFALKADNALLRAEIASLKKKLALCSRKADQRPGK
jgi:hypothetical protein